ncbi:MAG: inositol monophosphatase [bacterium]|nr:inositol monophosphatase [bacterium]
MYLHDILQDCLKAADIGSKIIISFYRSDYKYSFKTENKTSAVTEADLRTQEAVVDYLTAGYPEYGILAEEDGMSENRSRFEKEYHWQIDPIDGTLGFLKQTDNFGISISLVSRNGIPHVGVIYNPVRELLAYASLGEGAYLNNVPVKLSKKEDTKNLRIIISSNLLGKYPDEMKVLVNKFDSPEILSAESAVMKALYVIKGDADVFISPPLNSVFPWDLSAIACIASQCGGKLTDLKGNAINYNPSDDDFCKAGYLFCSEKIHEQIINILPH